MFGIFKKIKSWFVDDAEVIQPPVAPYKIEAPVNPQITDAVTAKPAPVKLRQPGTPKQGQKKPTQGKKPQGAKPAGNKPRGRRPKAKPAAPQQ